MRRTVFKLLDERCQFCGLRLWEVRAEFEDPDVLIGNPTKGFVPEKRVAVLTICPHCDTIPATTPDDPGYESGPG